MTEDKTSFDKKVSNIINKLDELDTSEIDDIEHVEKKITNFSDILSKISKNPDLAIGTEIGQWQIEDKLGQGGMSIVYQVKRNDDALKQSAALKIIPQAFATNHLIKRFLRERQILSDLNHQNIAKLYDAGITKQDIPWFVMELVEGKDILTYANDHQLNIEQRIILFKQVCQALSYAHAHGVIHRDIKPNNLMVNDDGIIKLLDFGIASDQQQSSLTMTGAVIGTPGYMSPEQAKGMTHELDRRSDIFSLGVLLYKLLQHKMPFEADSISEVCYRIIHDEPTLMDNSIPIELQSITYKCLEKKTENRYHSVKELNTDLNAYLNGDIVSARKITLLGRIKKKITKYPLISGLITTAIATTLLGIGYGIYQSYESLYRIQVAEKHLSRAQEIKAKVRRTHMMPLHNVIDEYKEINNDIIQLKEDIDSSQTDTSGLSSFALGSAYLSMRAFDLAHQQFKDAEQKGWKSPELSGALGITLAMEWDLIQLKALSITNKQKKHDYLNQKTREVFDPAMQYLKEAQLNKAHSDYLLALMSWIDKDTQSAIKHIENEIIKYPWYYEAHNFASKIYAEAFIDENNINGYQAAKKYLDLSNQRMDQAIAIGESDPFNYSEYCSNLGLEIQLKLYYDPEKLDEVFHKGIKVCEDALILAPEPKPAGIYRNISYLYSNKADYEEQLGNSTIELHKSAYDIAQQGLMIHPDSAELLSSSAVPLRYIGTYYAENQSQDEDPAIYFQKALENSNKSLAINPNDRTGWSKFASLQNAVANYYKGINNYDLAQHHYQQSVSSHTKVIELGNRVSGMANIAVSFDDQAKMKFTMQLPDEGIQLIRQAVSKSEEIFAFNNDYFVVYSNYLEFQFNLVKALSQHGHFYQDELNKGIKKTNEGCQFNDLKNNQIIMLKNAMKRYIDHNLAQTKDFHHCQQLINQQKNVSPEISS